MARRQTVPQVVSSPVESKRDSRWKNDPPGSTQMRRNGVFFTLDIPELVCFSLLFLSIFRMSVLVSFSLQHFATRLTWPFLSFFFLSTLLCMSLWRMIMIGLWIFLQKFIRRQLKSVLRRRIYFFQCQSLFLPSFVKLSFIPFLS